MWVDFKQTKHARIKVKKNIEINKIFKTKSGISHLMLKMRGAAVLLSLRMKIRQHVC